MIEHAREVLMRYFGEKYCGAKGVDFDQYLKRSGSVACSRFYAEADAVLAALDAAGLSVELASFDELLEGPAPAKKAARK